MSTKTPTTLVVNTSASTMHVDIVMPNGAMDSINVMPKSRENLPEGATVCSNFQYRNPKLKVHTPAMQAAHYASLKPKAAPIAPTSSKTSTDTKGA